ncbi:MAG: hypothetical protein AAB305_01145 [Candidatus Zixiibacteriota bacterium]
MNKPPHFKLLLSAFTLGLTAILLTVFVSQGMAETTKQKRERLKAKSSQLKKPHEPGKSCVGIKYGGITSTHVTVKGVNWDSTKGENTWTGSFYFEGRVAPKWFAGASVDVLRGTVFSTFTNTLYDVSLQLKFNPMRESPLNIRPSVAFGYGLLGEKYSVPKTTFFSKKLFLEFRYRLTPRFGLVADAGMWWVNGSNKFADVTGNCVFGRLGIWLR